MPTFKPTNTSFVHIAGIQQNSIFTTLHPDIVSRTMCPLCASHRTISSSRLCYRCIAQRCHMAHIPCALAQCHMAHIPSALDPSPPPQPCLLQGCVPGCRADVGPRLHLMSGHPLRARDEGVQPRRRVNAQGQLHIHTGLQALTGVQAIPQHFVYNQDVLYCMFHWVLLHAHAYPDNAPP